MDGEQMWMEVEKKYTYITYRSAGLQIVNNSNSTVSSEACSACMAPRYHWPEAVKASTAKKYLCYCYPQTVLAQA